MSASEIAEHVVVAQWLSLRPDILWCHPPNGGFRYISTAKLMQRLGCQRGVPDLLIWTTPPAALWPQPNARFVGCTGMAIEMKRKERSYLRPEQKVWLSRLSDAGWYATSCRGATEAISLLESAGYGTLRLGLPITLPRIVEVPLRRRGRGATKRGDAGPQSAGLQREEYLPPS